MARVLIVDDSPTVTFVFKRALAKAGYEVSTAADGQSGMNLARAERPDLILLDNQLPDALGVELCSTLKADAELQAIKVVLLTGTQDASLQSAGADGCLLKDAGPNRVLAVVGELLGKTG